MPVALSRMRSPSVSPVPSHSARMRLPSRYQAPLPGTAKGSDLDARRRAVGQRGSNGCVDVDRLAPDVRLVQHVEDAVGLQDRQHLGVRVDRERRALAHRQQPGDRVDLAIGQDDAGDRAVAQRAGLRMQLRRRDQLLAQVRRGVDQEPVVAVGADRDRGLGAPRVRDDRLARPGRPRSRSSIAERRRLPRRPGRRREA